MAVYLGSQKVGVTIGPIKADSGVKCMRGTATSDENGIVTFPAVEFTPSMLAIWNVKQIDLRSGRRKR